MRPDISLSYEKVGLIVDREAVLTKKSLPEKERKKEVFFELRDRKMGDFF